jgi:exodeoxyribonuclease VII small subunit
MTAVSRPAFREESMAKTKSATSYQELRAELDDIMLKLQAEELDVDKALEYYQRGLELTHQLDNYLKNATNRIVEIKAKFSDN